MTLFAPGILDVNVSLWYQKGRITSSWDASLDKAVPGPTQTEVSDGLPAPGRTKKTVEKTSGEHLQRYRQDSGRPAGNGTASLVYLQRGHPRHPISQMGRNQRSWDRSGSDKKEHRHGTMQWPSQLGSYSLVNYIRRKIPSAIRNLQNLQGQQSTLPPRAVFREWFDFGHTSKKRKTPKVAICKSGTLKIWTH